MVSPQMTAEDIAGRDPVVVLAADENFAMALAATVRSALDNLAAGRKLQLFILDGGIRESTKESLERSWPAGRFQVTWIDVDPSVLANVPAFGRINQVAYYRILMPRLLPAALRRVIYLDSDLIIRADLTQLWSCKFDGATCLAVQDCAAPYLDASLALSNFDKCGPHLGSPTPISNYRELGLDPMAAYFNSGVLVVDLEAWRNADLPRKMLNCLDRHRDHVRWWDQYALNVVLSGQWKPLDPRWNQGSHVYVFRNWTQSPYNRDTFLQVLDDPYIIHFTTRYKPWKVSCLHPLRHQFYRYVDRTEWAGWRPAWFNHPRSVLELLQAQQRRLRFARRRLQGSLLEWLQSLRWKEAKRLP